MICKECGHENPNPVMRPVSPRMDAAPDEPLKPVNTTFYVRWACSYCGRFHFRDGSLYSNPFRKT